MPKRSRGEQDEFPQQLQDAFTCATLDGGVGVIGHSVITQTEWDMPVELDLNHPIFIECSKIHCTQAPTLSVPILTVGIAGSPCCIVFREIKIMKEARGTTTWPSDGDRATLATFRMQTAFTALAAALCGPTYMQTDAWELYEDARTGLGELIAQPRLFVLTRTTVLPSGAVNMGPVSAKDIHLSMHYRLTDKVKGKEYLTELIAKFT